MFGKITTLYSEDAGERGLFFLNRVITIGFNANF